MTLSVCLEDVTLVYEPSVIRHSIWDTEALVFRSDKKLTECLEHEMATNQQVVVTAQDPEGPGNSPGFFTSQKKTIMGLSIAMIVLGVLSFILQVNFYHSHL